MKPIRLIQLLLLALTLTPYAPARAAGIDFSRWDYRFATPGLYSMAEGRYSREALLPDEDEIRIRSTDLSVRTNREVARVLVVPPGSDVVGTNAYTARAQTDFGQNHAEARTFVTGYGESDVEEYFDRRGHVSQTESLWADRWTFSGIGVGSAMVTLSVSLVVNISDSPCTGSACLGVGNPIFTRAGLIPWWYRVSGLVGVFDLDQLDQLFPEESDPIDVPHEVAAFDIYQQGQVPGPDFFGVIPNARLTPIRTNGTLSFVPVAGHRYAVGGSIRLRSESGADVDAGHTLSLDHVVLGSGLRLNSFAVTNGAQFNVLAATRLTPTRTSGGEVTLSFPSATGFTYHVEYKTALNATAWTPLATRTGNGNVQSVNDSAPGGPARYYRLRVQ